MGSEEVILCDTNIFIEIYRGNEKVIQVIEDISQNRIAISDVTAAELLYGARNKLVSK
jgi:predicted nucleic acid-binding protein